TDYDLPDDVADELLERWGQRCIPRWSPREFFKKKGSAARNRKRPIGYKAPGLAHFPDRRRDSAGAPSAAWTSAQGWWDELPSLATLEATGPVEWLMSRGIDPKIAAERDLGRVLDDELPFGPKGGHYLQALFESDVLKGMSSRPGSSGPARVTPSD